MMKLGKDLNVGDVIEIWFGPDYSRNRGEIISLREYKGPLATLWDGGAKIAKFKDVSNEMTIEPYNSYPIFAEKLL